MPSISHFCAFAYCTGAKPLGCTGFAGCKGSSRAPCGFFKAYSHEKQNYHFDACPMGGVEALYQLRRKAEVIVASPTETLVAGFPYTEIVPLLLTTPVGYAQLAQAYMSYYKGKSGSEQSATIAAVDAGQLEPLASLLRSILHAGNAQVAPPDKSKIQKYDLLEESVFYDLEGSLKSIIKDPAQLLRLRQQLAKAAIYRDYTPCLLGLLPLASSCGLSVCLPSGSAALDAHHAQLDWYAASGVGAIPASL